VDGLSHAGRPIERKDRIDSQELPMHRTGLYSTIVFSVAAATSALPAPANQEHDMRASVEKQAWGRAADGQTVQLYTLKNRSGMTMRVANLGCIIVSLTAPDRDGRPADVMLGYDRLEDYLTDTRHFGAVVGRYGNRIAGGRFTLDGKEYQLSVNRPPNHLHGGVIGFEKAVWSATGIVGDDRVGLKLHYLSPDGEEGYPGNLDATVCYWLTDDNELRIEYSATTDQPTPVNLTNHSYFNLAGAGKGDILGHELMLAADHFTPVDETLIPTGELRPVAGTPFDFTKPTPIGARVDADDQQIRYGGGYDHNFVFSRWDGKLRRVGTLYDPGSGRVMEMLTTEPGVQFYCGNFLNGKDIGKGGQPYERRSGLCLETQHFPDSPNRPQFPSCILRPDERYRHVTVYRFSTR
jgi:aldose 1-epimerase